MSKMSGDIPRRRLWVLYLAFGLLLTAGYFAVPAGSQTQSLIPVLQAFGTAVAITVGLLLYRPASRLPWRLLGLAQVLNFVAASLYFLLFVSLGREFSVPTVCDVFYIASYVAQLSCIAVATQRRSIGKDRSALLDAAIIAIGVALFSWIYIMSPVVHASGMTLISRLVTLAYPTYDIILVAMTARLAFTVGARSASFWFLTIGLLAQLVGDYQYAISQLNDTYAWGQVVYFPWELSLAFLGAAALHPSMSRFSQPSLPVPLAASIRWRLPLLTAAAVTPPGILILDSSQAHSKNLILIAATAIALFVMVLIRVAGLSDQVRRYSADLAIANRQLDDQLHALQVALDRERAAASARDALEVELRHAQKLESIGRLAGGVAHEINTPLQFVADNMTFISESVESLQEFILTSRRSLADDGNLGQLEPLEDDLAFICAELPQCLNETVGGIARVSAIVSTLQQFGDPKNNVVGQVDISEVLTTAATIARSEIDEVADVTLSLAELPSITGVASDLSQVFLHLRSPTPPMR